MRKIRRTLRRIFFLMTSHFNRDTLSLMTARGFYLLSTHILLLIAMLPVHVSAEADNYLWRASTGEGVYRRKNPGSPRRHA
jgi:hypothetical protein